MPYFEHLLRVLMGSSIRTPLHFAFEAFPPDPPRPESLARTIQNGVFVPTCLRF